MLIYFLKMFFHQLLAYLNRNFLMKLDEKLELKNFETQKTQLNESKVREFK